MRNGVLTAQVWRALLSAGVFCILSWHSANAAEVTDTQPAAWLQTQPLDGLPALVRQALLDALSDPDSAPYDTQSCRNFLFDLAELRPSLVDSVCQYLWFEFAPVRDTMVTSSAELGRLQTALLELGTSGDVGHWRDFVAIHSGWLQRLSAHPVNDAAAKRHPALRAWRVLRSLDGGQLEQARAGQALLGAPACPQACAHAALIALARGTLAFHDADRERALKLANEAAAHLKGALQREAQLVVLLAPDIAVLFDELAQYEARDRLFDLAEKAATQVLPLQHAARRHLGVTRYALLANQGQTEAAAEAYQGLQRDYGDTLMSYPLTAIRLRLGQSVLHYMRADYDNAVAKATRAGQQAEAALGELAPLAAEALNIVGISEGTNDRNQLAISTYREALRRRQQIFKAGHPLLSELNNNLSVIFHNMGRYDLAESFSQRSLDADRQFYGSDHEEVASDLYNLASVYRAMGEPARAIKLLLEAVRINTHRLGEAHRRTAIMHLGLGRAYMELGDFASSLASFETSVRLHMARDPQSRDVPIARHQAATAALALGHFDRARQTLLSVLVRYKDIYGDDHRHVAAAYRDLAEAQLGLGDTAAADDSLMVSLGALASGDALEVRWRALFALAEHEHAAKNDHAAVFFAKLALEVLQTLRASQGSLGRRLQRAFARQRADTYRHTANWLAGSHRLLEAQRVLDMLKDEEYYDFTRRTGGDGRRVLFNAAEQAVRSRLMAARQQVRSGDLATAAYRTLLAKERRTFRAPSVDLNGATPGAPRRESIAPGDAVIYFVVTDTTTLVIAATGEQSWRHEFAEGRQQMAARVLALRRELGAPDGDSAKSFRSAANELYDVLLRPVLDELEHADAPPTHLHLYLDDALRYLPFSALYDGRQYLAERYVLSRATATPGLASTAERPSRIAAFATSRATSGFPALPATLMEVDAIVRSAKEDDSGAFEGGIWTDDSFDRDALMRALTSGFDRVHVASHFQFVPGNERDSFLLLGNGQKLSLYDLRRAELSLDGLKLLALSGCDTALAAPGADGREIDGFAQTAQRRGADNVVATLWAVDDLATAQFMEMFYDFQSKGDDAVVALGKTQRHLRDRHPYFWAPFVIWGPTGH